MKRSQVIVIALVCGVVGFCLHSFAVIINTPQWLPQWTQRYLFVVGRGKVLKGVLKSPHLRVADVHNFGGAFGGGYCSAECEIITTSSPLDSIRQACTEAGWVECTGRIGPDEGGWYRSFSASGQMLDGNTDDLVFVPQGVTSEVRGGPVLVVRYPYGNKKVLLYCDMWR